MVEAGIEIEVVCYKITLPTHQSCLEPVLFPRNITPEDLLLQKEFFLFALENISDSSR